MDFNEVKREIIQNLENEGYVNKKINYKELISLYEPYKGILPEKSFAEILGISRQYFYIIKENPNKKVTVLKRIRASQERRIEIEQELRGKGLSNSEINYNEFRELFSLYRNEMLEMSFAEILGLSSHSFRRIKSEPSKKVPILKREIEDDEVRTQIITDLRNKGYTNKSITYAEFLSLYNQYRTRVSEDEFARILSVNYAFSKKETNTNRKITILKTEGVDNQLKSSIIKGLNEKGYANKKIDYAEFLELFEPYKNDMKEHEFAAILGITPNTYYKLKLNKSKAIILKRREASQEVKDNIQNNLIKAGYVGKKLIIRNS